MKKLTAAQTKALIAIKDGTVTWKRGMAGSFPESFRPSWGKDLNPRTVRYLLDRGLCHIAMDDNYANDAPVVYGAKTAAQVVETTVEDSCPLKNQTTTMIKIKIGREIFALTSADRFEFINNNFVLITQIHTSGRTVYPRLSKKAEQTLRDKFFLRICEENGKEIFRLKAINP